MGYTSDSARLVALVAAIMLSLPGSRAMAAATMDQLVTIDQMLTDRNWGALWTYVMTNPALLQGEDPLAEELRMFVSAMNLGTMDEFVTPRRERDPITSPY